MNGSVTNESVWQSPLGHLGLVFGETLAMLVPLLIMVAYLTYAERKVLAAMQVRKGPNVVGPFGLLQPFADAIKMLMKETIIPSGSNRLLFLIAPMVTFGLAMIAWAVIPVSGGWVIADYQCWHPVLVRDQLNGCVRYYHRRVGEQFEIRVSWRDAQRRANGELRSFDGVRDRFRAAVRRQPEPVADRARPAEDMVFHPAVPDVHRLLHLGAGGDQPLSVRLAGRRKRDCCRVLRGVQLVEFRAVLPGRIRQHDPDECAYHHPVPGWLAGPFGLAPALGPLWFFLKICFCLFVFIWVRATFPRYRYDQLMRLGWKVFLPASLLWLVITAGGLLATGFIPVPA